MSTRVFIVSGMKPAYGKAVNDLVAACDLGVEGAYIRARERATVTLRADVTPAQLARQPDAIRAAYEAVGWRAVDVQVEN